jgi:hypothetical protein
MSFGSAKSSSNASGTGGVLDCAACSPLPSTLTLEITSTTDGGCVPTQTVDLTFVSDQPLIEWVGTFDCGGVEERISVYCAGVLIEDMFLTSSQFPTQPAESSSSCDPLDLIYYGLSVTCDNGCGATIDVVVTE